MKKLQIIFVVIIMGVLIACTKDNSNNSIDSQLIGHWKFAGFIDVHNKLTQISIHADCDSCMSLFISLPNKYYGRSYYNVIATTFDTIGNKLMLGPYNSGLLPDSGEVENKFYNGIWMPSMWRIKNNHLYLTTIAYSDTLLFVAQ